MKVALVYDRVNKIGGAERVLTSLHRMYPEAPLFTAVYHKKNTPWADTFDVHPSFLDRFPLARSTHEIYPWLTPLAFESFTFDEFDVVISVTSAEAKGIITKPSTLHICYCLTPTRYLWVDARIYQKSIPALVRPLTKPAFAYLRSWDKIASQRPDHLLAISETVKTRIKKYYQRNSEIVYPPVNIGKFSKKVGAGKRDRQGEFFLVVSRLVPYKRMDLVIEAFNQLREKLVIVGTGIEMHRLKKQAGPSIHFLGKLTDEELVRYYQRCRALIFPQEEDFGISIVEAQAAGKPVIAFNKGGATEIIRTGKTGMFFSRQTSDALIEVLREFDERRFNPLECQRNATRFRRKRFNKAFSAKVSQLWEKYRKEQ